MAELILTEEEKQAPTWLELDDETIGKIVKATQLTIFNHQQETEKIHWFSAALILCSLAVEANADKYSQDIIGLTLHGKKLGDWNITVKKCK